ncbi:MAG: hypothetical protein EZS28_026280 [Streblomastix strix]|uniref:Uncharacterized protein n=1 Tax=Streblomastix strix TaxID=222440 RepID=A0A5J4V6Y4_9EUKA|nr:MAG: hypothetical protein EZS28_026280 [Streblomastix strix]
MYLITLWSLIKSYPPFYHVLCAVFMSLMCDGNSGIRGVHCCGCAGICGINKLCTLMIDVVLCRGLSTVYVAACSIN